MHDAYIKAYVSTGKAKIIGRPRDLIAQTRDGSMIPVKLAVSEQWVGTVRIFTATIFIREEETVNGSTSKNTEKSVLQQERESVSHLAMAAIVIDQRGLIQAFNPAAEKVWGFSFTDVAGRNVKVLMGFADAERHDEHVRFFPLSLSFFSLLFSLSLSISFFFFPSFPYYDDASPVTLITSPPCFATTSSSLLKY